MTMTYLELKTAIEDYVQNDEATFVANIPLFIRLSEERILKNVQLNLFRKNATSSTTGAYLACPPDFLAPFSLSLTGADGAKFFLELKDVSFLQLYNPNPATTGEPKYYGQFDVDNFLLTPTPDVVYTAELHYMYRPTSITAGADGGTTWLSENAEIALLYGALLEAALFNKLEPAEIQTFDRRFQEALVGVKMLGEAKEVTDEYRAGKVRRQKQ